jgi:hypothetical protein
VTREPDQSFTSRRPRRRLACAGCAAAAALGVCSAAPDVDARPRPPLWDVSGRWDGFNGAEYLTLRQHARGRVDITVHHTCAPGHLELGRGRIRGDRLRGRVEPRQSPPPGCARFAVIDVRVASDGRGMRGRYRTDSASGLLIYNGRRQARSLVRFRPLIRRRGGRVQVLLRPRPALPGGARARVRLCGAGKCTSRRGRFGPLFEAGRDGRCARFRASVGFASSRASTHRRLCL